MHRYDYEPSCQQRCLRPVALCEALCAAVRVDVTASALLRGQEVLCELSRIEQLPRCRSYVCGLLAALRCLCDRYALQEEMPLKTVVADLLAGGFAGRGDGYPAAPLRAIDVMSALNRLRAPELFVMR